MLDITKKPPESVAVNGNEYPINYDFKVWIDISILLADFDYNAMSDNDYLHNFEIISKVFLLAFTKIPNEPIEDILNTVLEFYAGYPKIDNGYTSTEKADGTKLYSFKHDINYIILAIRNQTGIDLSYKRDKLFHWWDFMLEFQTLEDHHYISKIMSYRNYSGDDKNMIALRESVALPKEYTRNEQKIINDIDKIFYNA